MMAKTIEEVLKEESGFFAQEFLEDMLKMDKLTEQHASQVQAWLVSLKDYKELSNSEAWSVASQQTGLTIEDIQSALKPSGYIARVCADYGIRLDDLLYRLDALGVFKKSSDPKTLNGKFQKIVPPLSKLVVAADEATSPRLPLLYLRSVNTRCVVVSEFYDRFDIKHGVLSDFHPKIKKLHVRTTLELEFKNDVKEPIGIVLTPDTLSELKRALEAMEIEMLATKEYIGK